MANGIPTRTVSQITKNTPVTNNNYFPLIISLGIFGTWINSFMHIFRWYITTVSSFINIGSSV